MTYEEAFGLKAGDSVIIKKTGRRAVVESIDGTLDNIFILLDDGVEYQHTYLVTTNKQHRKRPL